MAKIDKVSIELVMNLAKCEERTAKLYLRAHKGNVSRAAIAAKEDVALTEIAKMGKPITLEDFTNKWS